MLDLVISGCNGRMGRVLEELCAAAPDLQIKAGFDILGPSDREFPVFANPAEFQEEADVVVDFSHPAALTALLDKSGCLKEYFSKFEQKEIKQRLKEIAASPNGRLVGEMVEYIYNMIATMTVLTTMMH